VIAIAASTLVALLAGVLIERRWSSTAQTVSAKLLEGVVYIVMPLVVFFTVIGLKMTASLGVGIAFGWVERLTVLLMAWIIGSRLLRLSRPQTGALMASVAIANTGYLGIPMTALILGQDQIGLAVIYENLINVPVVLLIGFGVGAAFGTKAGRTSKERVRSFLMRNPPLYALIAALLVPHSVSPAWGHDLAHGLALAIAPIGFFALGVNLMLEHDESGVRVFPPPLTKPIITALGLRLVIAPAVMLGLSGLLITAPDTFKLEAAMPAGINALVVAHMYGLDMKITVGAIAWSTALVVTAVSAAGLLGLF